MAGMPTDQDPIVPVPGQLGLLAEVDEPGVKLHADPHPTERAAAARALPKSGTARRRVYDRLCAVYPDGRTDDELQDALAMPPNTERPRRVELVELGLVVDSGRTRPSRYGNPAVVWVAVP